MPRPMRMLETAKLANALKAKYPDGVFDGSKRAFSKAAEGMAKEAIGREAAVGQRGADTLLELSGITVTGSRGSKSKQRRVRWSQVNAIIRRLDKIMAKLGIEDEGKPGS